jgi:hypothetical protein
MADLRRHRWTLVGRGLLIDLVGGAVVAPVIGARRPATAYDRLVPTPSTRASPPSPTSPWAIFSTSSFCPRRSSSPLASSVNRRPEPLLDYNASGLVLAPRPSTLRIAVP